MKMTYMRKLFFLIFTLILISCRERVVIIPCLDRVYVQWNFRDGAISKREWIEERRNEYFLSKDDQEILQKWIRDFVREANVDFVTYAPVLLIGNDDFNVNVLEHKIVLNIRMDDSHSMEQLSRKRNESDEEMVNWIMRIITKK